MHTDKPSMKLRTPERIAFAFIIVVLVLAFVMTVAADGWVR